MKGIIFMFYLLCVLWCKSNKYLLNSKVSA